MISDAGDTFPLPWEEVLWTAAPAFPSSLGRRRAEYALSEVRLVIRRHGQIVRELALDDVESVTLSQNWIQRLRGISTVRISSRRGREVLELADIQQGPQIALILQLRAGGWIDEQADAHFLRSALEPDAPRLLPPARGLLLAATVAFGLAFGVIGLARHSPLPPVAYADDDPIAPGGQRRPTREIVEFMEREVMPFARRVLGPLEGGADKVTCETCHGVDAVERNWQMPGVRALPEPELRLVGLEQSGIWIEPQVRNAVYGYLAEEDKQTTAGYMRRIVMPGMAALMHRPAYDFARSYAFNRSRAAVGCYHCHRAQ